MRARFLSRVLLCTVLAAAATVASAGAQQSGRAYTIPLSQRSSALAAFREAVGSLHALSSIHITSAFGDRSGTMVEGYFTATAGGAPVRGVIIAGRGGTAAIAYDRADRAARTVPALLARLGTAGGGGSSAVQPLHTVSFGSGSVGLPDTWQVANSYQGCVEAASTHDHGYLAFGCPQAGLAPPVLPGTDPRSVLVVPYSDPVTMFRAFLQYPQPAGLGVSGVRVAEARPVDPPMAGGRAVYVLFDYRALGQPFRGLALVTIAPTGNNSYMFYKSMFMLPQATFARLAPTLWRSWQSWGVSSGVLTKRLTEAAQSMRETGDIITGAYWDRQKSNARTSLSFDQYIRDAAVVENRDTGRWHEGNSTTAQEIVDANPEKYRIVPVNELIP